jgi:hypothetical protein
MADELVGWVASEYDELGILQFRGDSKHLTMQLGWVERSRRGNQRPGTREVREEQAPDRRLYVHDDETGPLPTGHAGGVRTSAQRRSAAVYGSEHNRGSVLPDR